MAKKLILRSPKIVDSTLTPKDLLILLLSHRGLRASEFNSFLRPPLPALNLPSLILNKTDKIILYGDYDVDGLTSTAILYQSLTAAGYQVTPFVPHRENDGYGFKAATFFRLQSELSVDFTHLITVDNGIVANSEFAKLLKKQPIKITVIDHHLPSSDLPQVDQIIHTPDTSASGIAYFMAKTFDSHADLGLAALGVVADCLPLTGLNRSLVVHGLSHLRHNPSPGIRQLMDISGVKCDTLSTYDLGYVIGPRLNAIGRLDSPEIALKLLCSLGTEEAAQYSMILHSANADRQLLQKESLEIAQKLVNTTHHLIFIAHHSFHPGIIGLIAGRLTEQYHLPSVIISLNGDIAKGSCRSIPKLNIIDSLRQFSGLFIDLGGHPGAAGFSIKSSNISKLKTKLSAYISSKLNGLDLTPTLEVEAQMKLSTVKANYIKAIKMLEPFGLGNPEPLFLFKQLKIVSKRLLGQTGDHLKLKLDDPATKYPENSVADAIGFKKGEYDKLLKVGDLVDIVASLSLNTYNGYTTPQLIIKEII